MPLLLRLSIIVVITSLASAQQQTPVPILKGKVVRAVVRGPVGAIRITVRDRETHGLIDGEQPSTNIEDWFHVAQIHALVDVEFDGGGCYEGAGHTAYRVRQVNPDFPKVTLQLTRDCKLAERLQQRRQSGARVRNPDKKNPDYEPRPQIQVWAGVPKDPDTTAAAIDLMNSIDDDLVPSPAELKQELEADAARARNGEFYDTFQYKFSLRVELYRNRAELNKVLAEFVNEPKNQDLFRAIGQTRPEMFMDVVRREFQTSEQVNVENILAVLKEDSISPVLRGSATVALLNGDSPNQTLAQATEFWRQQKPGSPIFETSLIARGRIGEAQDEAVLYNYIKTGDSDVRRAAMEALSLATLIEGPDVLKDGAKTLATVAVNDDDATVRAHAFQSLRPFVYQGDADAIRALFAGSQDRDPNVRLQVVLAFGVGKTEQSPKVRNLLVNLSAKDPSPRVREAAKLSLSGASTVDWMASHNLNRPNDQ